MYTNKDIQEYVKKQKQLLKENIKNELKTPLLLIIQVGDNPSSNSYIKGKIKDCDEVGMKSYLLKLKEDIKEKELINYINDANINDEVDGIIVQLPLPKHIDIKKIQLAINPIKDVDGFHPMSKFKPCTPLGVVDFLKFIDYEFDGKTALVIGRSDCVGKPLAQMLTDLNMTVTLAHTKTPKETLYQYCDFVFTCTNEIEHIDVFNDIDTWNYIDIGLGVGKDGKLHGNITSESHKTFISNLDLNEDNEYTKNMVAITGIGGVGLLTRLSLLKNTYQAYLNQN